MLLQLRAGADAGGNPVLEKVEAYALEAEGHYELIKSPLFIRNLAAGDIFRADKEKPGLFTVIKRSGMLSVRVFCRGDPSDMERELTPEVEKLGGRLDRASERALAYSLHVNLGFQPVEALFDRFTGNYPDCVWYYGNVYDPRDGVTPLNWWQDFIKV